MNVKELIEHLSQLDPNLMVYTAIDEEGNGYNKAYFAPTIYLINEDDVGNHYLDGVYSEEDWKSEQEDGYIDEDAVPAKIVVI